jgi:Leucine-rich repeat (LRR) protein
VLDWNDNIWATNSTCNNDRNNRQKNTQKLSLHGTALDKISQVAYLNMFKELEVLNVSGNTIKIFDAMEFKALDRLRILDLSENQIQEIVGDFQKSLTRLEILHLDNNYLQTLHENITRPLFERLQYGIYLINNPLHYNCELRWLSSWLVASGLLKAEQSGWNCIPPTILNTTLEWSDSGQMRLVCIATGDPVPRVFWSPDFPVDITVPILSQQSLNESRVEILISRAANYTCTAVNVAGSSAVTIDISHQDGIAKMPPTPNTIHIINTPLGVITTFCLIVVLALLVRRQ